MELKKTLNRFCSILLIVTLGVAFFAGIRAAEGDMRYSLDEYFDEQELFDIRILGSLGLTQEDLDAVLALPEVTTVEGGHTIDQLSNIGGSQKVLKVAAQSESFNQKTLTEGSAIDSVDQCLVDAAFAENQKLSLGDTITVYSKEETDTDLLKQKNFIICGLCNSPEYISFGRGNTSLGQGEVDAFILVSKDAFDSDSYTQMDVRVQGAKEATAYTDSYEQIIEKVEQAIEEDVAPLQEQTDYDRVQKEGKETLAKEKSTLQDGWKEYEANRLEIQTAESQLEMAYMAFLITAEEYESQRGELSKALEELEEAKTTLEEGQAELAKAEEELASMEECTWYVLTRNDLPQYDQGGENADRIAAIGKVFPVIFFLVAALISLTTMTRMVEEERTQIGTLKALGYKNGSIASKYFWYALLATALGSILGILVGEKVIPAVIVLSYQIMYPGIPNVVIPYEWKYSLLATITALVCTLGATVFSCYRELLAPAAELMRPVPPKNGKRILLERITFLWKHFSFTQKSALRNMFRYKKRFFMTILGIGGCMGLMVFGFGLKDSIFDIVDLQYGQITRYQAMISLEEDHDREMLDTKLKEQRDISYDTFIYLSNLSFSKEEKAIDAYLFVPEESDELKDFLTLRDRETKEGYALDETGVIITEKLAKRFGVAEGDSLTMHLDGQEYALHISHITENYMYHYVYMTPAYFKQITGSEAMSNTIIYQTDSTDENRIRNVGEAVMKEKGVLGITYMSSMRAQLDDMLKSLDAVIVIVVGAAGMLAFIVLYNLNNININERKRELATIKVLGFYNNEVASYVYRENVLLTILGICFGAVFGKMLHMFIIATVEIDTCMFSRSINLLSFFYSGILTVFFAAVVNLVMYYKLKKIDMIESLKSVE